MARWPSCPVSPATGGCRRRALRRSGNWRRVRRQPAKVALDADPRLELAAGTVLRSQAAAEADQLAVGADHPMARHHHRHRVAVAGRARPPGPRPARRRRRRSRRRCASRRTGWRRSPAQTARSNRCRRDERQRHVEVGPLAGEVRGSTARQRPSATSTGPVRGRRAARAPGRPRRADASRTGDRRAARSSASVDGPSTPTEFDVAASHARAYASAWLHSRRQRLDPRRHAPRRCTALSIATVNGTRRLTRRAHERGRP